MELRKRSRRNSRNQYSPETLAEALKRTAVNIQQRRPLGGTNTGPYWNGLEIPNDLEEWRGRAIAGPLFPSGQRQLKDERSDEVCDEQDPVALEGGDSAYEFLCERLGLHSMRSPVVSDPDLEARRKRNVVVAITNERIAKRKTGSA